LRAEVLTLGTRAPPSCLRKRASSVVHGVLDPAFGLVNKTQALGHSGARAQPAIPEPMHTGEYDGGPVFIDSERGPLGTIPE
jgi:hypothetical protein